MRIIGLCMLCPITSWAQQLLLSPVAEKTIVNYQLGAAFQLQSRAGWRAGGFYQQAITQTSDVPVDHYWGIIAAAPLVKSDKLVLYLAARAGIVNRHFFTVSPSLNTSVKLSKLLSTDTGISYRKGYLSALMSLNVHLNL
jgi:hypothetical protein